MRMGLDLGRVHVLKSHFTPDVFTVLFTPSVFGPLLFTPLSVLSPEGARSTESICGGSACVCGRPRSEMQRGAIGAQPKRGTQQSRVGVCT